MFGKNDFILAQRVAKQQEEIIFFQTKLLKSDRDFFQHKPNVLKRLYIEEFVKELFYQVDYSRRRYISNISSDSWP